MRHQFWPDRWDAFSPREFTNICKLIDGSEHIYGAMADKEDAYNPKIWKFIGRGIHYKCNDIILSTQSLDKPECIKCFFVKADRSESDERSVATGA